ncbi:unnamed protein product [Meloidogyne enterolobii]|uniref:Uncharacterized protein n=1 Tax=Meloidogyne enterolobii TaxID=390850 RepID=A0ACB1B7A2_MELEN
MRRMRINNLFIVTAALFVIIMLYLVTPPKVLFERSSLPISPLEELLPLLPTSIPEKVHVHVKNEGKDNNKDEGEYNKKNGGKEDKKVQGKDHDHKKDVQLKKVVDPVKIKEEIKHHHPPPIEVGETTVVFPPAKLKYEIKEIAKSDKEFKPDLDAINKKIWNSFKHEIRHSKVGRYLNLGYLEISNLVHEHF